jgi:hypothetical protein
MVPVLRLLQEPAGKMKFKVLGLRLINLFFFCDVYF